MTDIHCHIIPGVDDGAGDLVDGLEMAGLAQSSGVTHIIATPHCNIPGSFTNRWTPALAQRFQSLQQALKDRGIGLELHPGQEVFLTKQVPELLRRGELITLAGSRYLLVEFGPEETGGMALRKLQQLLAEGYTPIVAHPERYGFFTEDKSAMYRLKETGALLQINKGSLMGRFGHRALVSADRMLRHRQADFVASDAHSQYSRTPYLADVHELLCERYDPDYAELLLQDNPRRVIENRPVFGG